MNISKMELKHTNSSGEIVIPNKINHIEFFF